MANAFRKMIELAKRKMPFRVCLPQAGQGSFEGWQREDPKKCFKNQF